MGRTAVTAHERARRYSNEGLHATDSLTVFCNFCHCRVAWEKKDNIVKHIKSEKHVTKRGENSDAVAGPSQTKQTSVVERLDSSKRRKVSKDHFSKRTVEVFAKANIPLEKLENQELRAWIKEFSNQELASVKTLREKYLPEVACDHRRRTTEAVAGKKINILCDETTDRMGRCVFVIIFQIPAESERKLFVAAVNYLEAGNATSCSRAVLDALRNYNVPYDAVKVFVSDSAPYMNLCYETLRVVIGDHLLHVQCWTHKLSLVGNCWVTEMSDLNHVVTMVKSAFLNTRKRKYKYLNFIKSQYGDSKEAKVFPSPVLTRWNSWFHAVFYLNEYFQDIVTFFKSCDMKDINNCGIKYLKDLTGREVNRLHSHMVFVKDYAVEMVDLLTEHEGSQYPTSHLLYPKLHNLEITFSAICDRGSSYSAATNNALAKLTPLEQAACKDIFVRAAHSSKCKLESLIAKDPNQSNFVRVSQALYPKNIILKSREAAELKKLFSESILSQKEIWSGYTSLRNAVQNQMSEGGQCDIMLALTAVQTEFPAFAKLCFDLLWTPTNNVDSERVLSHYNTVVTDRRCNLKEDNAELMTMLSFEQ